MKPRFTGNTLALLAALSIGLTACSTSTTKSTTSEKMASSDKTQTETKTVTPTPTPTSGDKKMSHRMVDSNGQPMTMDHDAKMMNKDAKADEKAAMPASGAAAGRRGEMRDLLMKSTAVAQVKGAEGSKIEGRVFFTKEGNGVRVVANIRGLTPGEHGFHVHQNGDCSAPDFKSAGDHFNPMNKTHGAADPSEHHMGDMGNITADDKGMAHYDELIPGLSLDGDTSVIGKGIVIHAGVDDLKTQPSGNSGARIACGVIVDSTEMKTHMQQRPAGGGRRASDASTSSSTSTSSTKSTTTNSMTK